MTKTISKSRLSPEQLEAKEKLKEKRREYVQSVAKMKDEELIELKKVTDIVTCEGRVLSLRNSILLDGQSEGDFAKPITVVGGYKQWLSLGYQVKSGETSLTMLAPRIKKDISNAEVKDGEKTRISFSFVPVFDIQQVEQIEDLEIQE